MLSSAPIAAALRHTPLYVHAASQEELANSGWWISSPDQQSVIDRLRACSLNIRIAVLPDAIYSNRISQELSAGDSPVVVLAVSSGRFSFGSRGYANVDVGRAVAQAFKNGEASDLRAKILDLIEIVERGVQR